MRIAKGIAVFVLALAASAASAQTIKIGFISSYSGLNANLGPYMERAVRMYIKQHEKELPPGVKIELVIRDDTGPNPDKAKQLAQELVVRDRVNILAGVIWTPNAMSIAPIATEAKVPFVIMNAGTAVITTRSPYIARTSFTLWQSSYPLGTWAAKKFKTAYTLVSDFGPGHDSEEAFTKSFSEGGGMEEGVRRQRDAELPFRRLVGRHGAHLRGDQAAEGQARSREDYGDLQAVQESRQPARPDLDRSRHARHHPAGVPARGAQGRRPARQRGDRDALPCGEGSLERTAEEEVSPCRSFSPRS